MLTIRQPARMAHAVCVLAMLAWPCVLNAQLVNGNFEGGFAGNGVANGWTLFATSGYNPSGVDETVNVHGPFHAQKIVLPQPGYGKGEGYGGIFQVISTVPGQLYRIDFWLYASMPGENYEGEDLQIHLGFDAQGRAFYNHSLVDFDMGWIGVDADRNVWKSMGREFLAAGTQATLFFRGWRKYEQHGTGYMIIDDVTIQPVDVTHPVSIASTPPPVAPTLIGPNLLANPDFENGFTGGVGNNWQGWTTRGSGTFKPSTDLGKIGGGHYNPELPHHVTQFLYLSQTAKVAFAMPPALNQLVTIKQRDPQVLTIGRHIDDDFNFWDRDDAGTIAEARAHAERCYAKHLEKPGIDAWQGFNEPWVQSRERARKAGLFAQAFAERCHELGIRSCVLNLGVANPPNTSTADFFKDALAVTDFVGYHAYGGSNDQWQTGPQQNQFALRWRAIKARYDQMGWRHPAVVYTEAGTYFGWKAIGDEPDPELCRDKYIEFGPYMHADDWVVGETIFTVGGYGLWEQWDIADDPLIIAGIRPWNQAHSADARGGKSQEWYHQGASFRGGIVQTVNTSPGNYWLSGWLKYETGPGGGDPRDPYVAMRIGYDPTGQSASANAGTIVWSEDQMALRYLNAYIWYPFGVPVLAAGSQTSIWFAMEQLASGPTARAYVDALDLRAVSGAVPPPMAIELNPISLTPTAEVGTDAPAQTFTVRNSGGGTLVYFVSDDADWLSVSPGNGSSTGEADTITITYATASLPTDFYTATIEVTANGVSNSPQTVELLLTMGDPPPPGDFDGDFDVDQDDFGQFQSCLSGQGVPQTKPNCRPALLDEDEDVDQEDLAIFQGCVSGPGVPANMDCAD